MISEQMAMIRRELEANPRAAAAIAHAETSGARLVAESIATCRIAGRLSALGLGVEIADDIAAFFAETVRRAATTLRLEMQEAADIIAYDIGWLLDAHAPSDRIMEAARLAAGPLSPAQVDAIVARETAWWVRLHAQLGQAA